METEIQTKKCNICRKIFINNENKKSCSYCLNKAKQYYVKNRETIIKRVEKYTTLNKNKISSHQKIYYLNNKETINHKLKIYRENNKHNINKRERASRKNPNIDTKLFLKRQLINKYKTDVCVDCGTNETWKTYEFDHVGPKKFNISSFYHRGSANGYSSIDDLQLELSNCEIVCYACHKKRTSQRLFLSTTKQAIYNREKSKKSRDIEIEFILKFKVCQCGCLKEITLDNIDHIQLNHKDRNQKIIDVATLRKNFKAHRLELVKTEPLFVKCHQKLSSEQIRIKDDNIKYIL